jgi:hypothetical protein
MLSGIKKYLYFCITCIFIVIMAAVAQSAMTGQCSNCHTMHNSQGGAVMVNLTYGAETTDAKEFLLRGTCLGCHAQNTVNRIESLGGTDVPQVYHRDSAGDLAGGNFAYIYGIKGSGASNKKGHNIADLGSMDTPAQPPGRRHDISTMDTNFTCAGSMGCHGVRGGPGAGLENLEGSHHQNAGGQLNTADNVYNSYRFLSSVKGYENDGANKWQNLNSTNHNEYFGAATPMSFTGCTSQSCHDASDYARPLNNTMSGFCATCHGYFHLLDSGAQEGVGDDTTSPFTRHPTDVILPNSGEYTSYTSYSVATPVARTSVPASMSGTVTPGSDVVMCLSCHGAHATDYYKMMRWDIKSATLATAISGCGSCHTDKN